MEVRLADCAGFCFGVKRAVDTVYEQLKNGKTIYTYGPIVHNEEVVRELAEKGVRVLESKESRYWTHWGYKGLQQSSHCEDTESY